MPISPMIPVLAGSLLAAGCLAGAFTNLRHKRTIDDLPTSKTQGVFIGLAELKGTAESEAPLTSYLTETRCVYYFWEVEEHWRRTVTETYTDSKGRTRTRSRTESGWRQVAQGSESIPFFLKDDTGIIRIVPEGAKIQASTVFNQTVSRSDPLYYAKGPAGAVPHSTHQRRFCERVIPLHAMLYVLGQAQERQDVVAAEIAQDKAAPLFIISTHSEKQISSRYSRWCWFWIALGMLVALGAGAGWAFLSDFATHINWQPLAVMGAGYLLILCLVWIWTTYNSLINMYHRVKQGWSQVDVQLKRRYDLINNLVKVVEGYRDHEKGTFLFLTELRGQIESVPQGGNLASLKGLSPVLRATIENYPDMKANDLFYKLQESLADTEQRIALARDYYNEIATFYNTRLEIIPDRYVAVLAGLRPQTLINVADFERAPVQINLAD
jgi:hypothetical protein